MTDLYTRVGGIFRPITADKKYYGDEDLADIPSRAWDKVKPRTDQVEDAEIIEEHKVLHIGMEIYQNLSDRLIEQINGRRWISDEQVITEPDSIDVTHILTISAYLDYDRISAPEGRLSELSNINPVWVECHSYKGADAEELLNDFSMSEFKKYML